MVNKKHRFVATAIFDISREELDAHREAPKEHPLPLDQQHLISLDVGCLDCRQPWEQCLRTKCRGKQVLPGGEQDAVGLEQLDVAPNQNGSLQEHDPTEETTRWIK